MRAALLSFWYWGGSFDPKLQNLMLARIAAQVVKGFIISSRVRREEVGWLAKTVEGLGMGEGWVSWPRRKGWSSSIVAVTHRSSWARWLAHLYREVALVWTLLCIGGMTLSRVARDLGMGRAWGGMGRSVGLWKEFAMAAML
jgi:hypothetical protein